jgi:hypothetical protein
MRAAGPGRGARGGAEVSGLKWRRHFKWPVRHICAKSVAKVTRFGSVSPLLCCAAGVTSPQPFTNHRHHSMTSRQGGPLLGTTIYLRRLFPAACLALILSCCNGTGNNGDLVPSPSYSWRGQIVDSVTGAPVDHTTLRIRERPEHQAAGLLPHLEVQRFSNHLFLAEYTLGGFNCIRPPDTTLTLHLEVIDSLGRYQPAVHQSTWLVNCGQPPEPAPQPFPREDRLRFLLHPIP